MISGLDNLIKLFHEMQADGWDTNSPLKWGFYFVDSDKEKLKRLFLELKEKNYILEKIYMVDHSDSEWTLRASKNTLTPEKLHKRNIAFNELANYCGVSLYDGWDVEKI
ncbi:MAG: ribonuclease E inhibitor RraB [Bacteroidota bacterium]